MGPERRQAMRLRPEVALDVVVADDTPFGSPLSAAPDKNTPRLFGSVLQWVNDGGLDTLLEHGPRLLVDAVADTGAGFLEPSDDELKDRDASVTEPGITFLGHNTVVVRSTSAAVVVDPLLYAAADPNSPYRPLRLADVGRTTTMRVGRRGR